MNPDYGTVIVKSEPIKEEVFIFDTSESARYCDGNHKASSDVSSMVLVEHETKVIGNKLYKPENFKCMKIKLENEEFQGTEDTFVKEEKPNVIGKCNPEICDISNFNFYGIKALTKAEVDKNGFEESEPVLNVKDEEISIDENLLVKEEIVEGKL